MYIYIHLGVELPSHIVTLCVGYPVSGMPKGAGQYDIAL